MFKRAFKAFAPARDRLGKIYRKKILVFIDRRPLASFFVLLGAIVLLIIISNLINRPPATTVEKELVVKNVEVYRIGSAPKITVSAKTIKSGVIQITALTAGVVDTIFYYEGATVNKGTTLIGMSSNYQGGNTFSLARQIAAEQYKNINDSHPTQKEIIQKQIEIAKKTDENSDQLREITQRSIDDTKNLISLNEDILNSLEANINTLTQTATDSALLLSTKQLKSQFVNATNAARAALENAQLTSSSDKPPAQLSDLQKEVAIKQLEIQQKQLDLNKEISRLQLLIAQVNEATMFPQAPFNGTVQRVLVKENQAVTPGTALMVFSKTQEDDPITAVAFVSQDVASRISVLEPSILHIGSSKYSIYPSFISTEAVEGTLYAVYYPIPEDLNSQIVSEGYILVDIPVGYFNSSVVATFIPMDSVYQTREKSYVFVVEKGMAKSKTVVLGSVFGRFVEVISGIGSGDQIIVNRNVVDGDPVMPN